MLDVLSGQGFTPGEVGNNNGGHVPTSQVQAAKADDLGAQAVSKALGNVPVVADASVTPGSVRVVLAGDYTGPGSGLGPESSTGTVDPAAVESTEPPPPPSPVLTAGTDNAACVS